MASFPTKAQNSDFLMDERDGNIYLVARFNTLWWMCQNLKFDAGEGSSCYNEDETNCMLNGRMYDWSSAQRSCPEGYRLASDEDWQNLESYIGMEDSDLDKRYNRESGTVGRFLKPNGGLSFDAEYAGMMNPKGNSSYSGGRAFFWTSTEMDENMSWTRLIDKNRDGVERQPMTRDHKLSVRCVRDATPEEMMIEEVVTEEKTEEPEPTEEAKPTEVRPVEEKSATEAPAEERGRGQRPDNRKKGERKGKGG